MIDPDKTPVPVKLTVGDTTRGALAPAALSMVEAMVKRDVNSNAAVDSERRKASI
jgi:hypothetical protein